MADQKTPDPAPKHDLTTRVLLGLFFVLCCVFALFAAAISFADHYNVLPPDGPLKGNGLPRTAVKMIWAFVSVLFLWLAGRIYKVWSRK